jgi:hypothetical protein
MPSLNAPIVFYMLCDDMRVRLPALNASIVVHTLRDDIRMTMLISWECPHSTLRLYFTQIASFVFCHASQWQIWREQSILPVHVRIQCFYCVSQTLRRCQGHKVDCLEMPSSNASILFYMLWDDIRVAKLISSDCPQSTLPLCFTRSETISEWHLSYNNGFHSPRRFMHNTKTWNARSVS